MREYATQMEAAKRGIVPPEMKTVAEKEFTDPEIIRERVAVGQIAIPANINHKSLCAEGIGKGLRTKINVNLGISGDANNYDAEMDKVRMALRFGAEAIMDLSNYGKTNTFRQQLIALSPAMIGTVPMYDAIGYLEKDLLDITAQDFFKVVRAHAEEGVDFMTIHAGINRRSVEAFKRDKRKMNIVSRGGSLLIAWMEMTGHENPFYEYYDEVLDILREYEARFPDKLRREGTQDAPPVLGYQARQKTEPKPVAPSVSLSHNNLSLTDDQICLLRTLTEEPMLADDLIELTGIPTRRVLSALTVLEIEHLVTQHSGKRYARAVNLTE